jgi:hypothetical protein
MSRSMPPAAHPTSHRWYNKVQAMLVRGQMAHRYSVHAVTFGHSDIKTLW